MTAATHSEVRQERRGNRDVAGRISEQRCDLARRVPGDAAAHRRQEESEIGMRRSVGEEGARFVREHIEAAHRVDRVRLPVISVPLTSHCTEVLVRETGSTTAVEPAGIRSEHEDLVRAQRHDLVGGGFHARDSTSIVGPAPGSRLSPPAIRFGVQGI